MTTLEKLQALSKKLGIEPARPEDRLKFCQQARADRYAWALTVDPEAVAVFELLSASQVYQPSEIIKDGRFQSV